MGLDVSHFEAPKGWPCLSWGEDVLQRFIECVKQNEEGTFRITKWGMVELVGKERLSDVAELFTVMEETGESSVSSLQLAIALVLCNEHASPSFKASQCFMLFDWAEKGMLGFSDILCLLQACTKALAQCMHSAFDHVGRDDLETLCHAAISAAGGSAPEEGVVSAVPVQSLTEWALADHRTASVLLRLSPNDHGVALVPSALSRTFTRFRASDGEAGQDGDAPRGESENGGLAQAQLKHASRQDQLDESIAQSIVDAEQAEGEPPLLQAVAGTDAAGQQFAASTQAILQELQRQLDIGAWLEDAHSNSWSPTSPGVRGKDIDARWARLLGEALVTMSTSISAPLDCAPFYPTVAPELLHHALRDWLPVNNACLVHEAQQQVALVASTQLGRLIPIDPSLQATAQRLASEQLVDLLQSLNQERQEGALVALQAELNKVIETALPAARAVYQARLCEVPAANEKRKVATRLEGALAYLAEAADSMGKNDAKQSDSLSTEGSQQLGQLRGKTGELLSQLKTVAKASEETEAAFREQWELFLSSWFLFVALRQALSDGNGDVEKAREVLGAEAKKLQLGSIQHTPLDLPEAKWFEEMSCTGQCMQQETENQWLRSEGKLVALRALARGQSVRYELGMQKVESALRASQDILASQHMMLIASEGGEPSYPLSGTSASPKQLGAVEHLLQVLEGWSDTEATCSPDELLAQALTTTSTDVTPTEAVEVAEKEPSPLAESADEQAAEGPLTSSSAGPEEAVSPPMIDSNAEEFTEDNGSLVMDLRALRFRRRSLEAAVFVVHDFLNDGTMAGIDSMLRQELTEVSQKLAAREATPAAQQRRQSKAKEVYATLLQELCDGMSKVDATAMRMKRHIFELYSSALTLQSGASSSRSMPSSRSAALPLRRQSSIPSSFGESGVAAEPPAWQPTVANGLDHVSSSKHAHAAYLLGSTLGLAIVELAAVMSASWPKTSQSGEREMLEDMPVLLRLSEFASESKFLLQVAEHYLMQCSANIIQLATGLDAKGQSKTADQLLGSSTEFSNDVLRLSKAAEAVLLDVMPGDVIQTLLIFATGPVLEQNKDMLQGLQESFQEVVGRSAAANVAVSTTPIWQWWRSSEQGIAAVAPEADPGDSCMQWSQHLWRAWRLPNSSKELSADAKERLESHLKDHALAFRLWCLAQHRALALEAIANRGWGSSIPRHVSRFRLRLMEVLRRTTLCQLAVGNFAATQQACTRAEMAFLQTLRPEHVHDTDVVDLDARAKQLEEVMQPARGVNITTGTTSSNSKLALEGVQETLELLASNPKAAFIDEQAQAMLQVQAGACKELLEASASQGKDGAGRHGNVDARSNREARWGSLRAMQHMRSCLLSAK